MSQGIHTTRRTRFSAAVAAVVAAFVLLLAPASPASAHDELLGSDPADGATVDALPELLTLTFSGAIATDEGANEVAVTDASGTSLVDGTPAAQDNVLTQPLSGEASGEITVLWKVVSSDGHPISGEFSFTVAAAPTPTETAAPTPTADETATPTESATPSASPSSTPAAPASDSQSSALPWIVLGLIAAALVAGVTYLLVSRSRRRKALAEASAGRPEPDSEPRA